MTVPADSGLGNHLKVSSYTYDSVTQKDLVEAWEQSAAPNDDLCRVALARLRMECLLTRRIVMTDAQALDGSVLAQLTTSGLINGLSRDKESLRRDEPPIPIEIHGRAGSLEESLTQMYMGDDRPKAFLPSVVKDSYKVRGELAKRRGLPRQRGLEGCVQLLRDADVDAAEVASVKEHWKYLLELEADRTILYKQRTTGLSAHLDQAEKYWPQQDLEANLLTDAGRDTLQEVLSLGLDRSRVLQVVRAKVQLRPDLPATQASPDQPVPRTPLPYLPGGGLLGPPDPTEVDYNLILHWYNERYLRAQAFQQGANYRGSSPVQPSNTEFHLMDQFEEHRVRVVDISLPAGFLTYLGQMSNHDWQQCQQHLEITLRPWWERGDVDQLRRAMDFLLREFARLFPEGKDLGTNSKVFGSSKITRYALSAGLAAGGVFLEPTLIGASLAILFQVGETLVEQISGTSPMVTGVEVTSYLSDPPA